MLLHCFICKVCFDFHPLCFFALSLPAYRCRTAAEMTPAEVSLKSVFEAQAKSVVIHNLNCIPFWVNTPTRVTLSQVHDQVLRGPRRRPPRRKRVPVRRVHNTQHFSFIFLKNRSASLDLCPHSCGPPSNQTAGPCRPCTVLLFRIKPPLYFEKKSYCLPCPYHYTGMVLGRHGLHGSKQFLRCRRKYPLWARGKH